MSRLLLIDGHAYAYRAFYAIRELRGPDGAATNAVYGFIKMLEKMRSVVNPTHLMVVWDGGLAVQRLELLPGYKAQRPEMPADLRSQIDAIQDYLAAEKVPGYCADGVEADDYIGTLAIKAAAWGWQVVIASADKDFMQLVTGQVGLLNPNDKEPRIWGRDEVVAKTGVNPDQVIDWLALMGDSVDNIPGVAGVGPKTAANLLAQFGSVAGIYGRLTEVKSAKMQAALAGAQAAVERNLKLVKLHPVECLCEPADLMPGAPDVDKKRSLFSQWGFKGMLAALPPMFAMKQEELI
ncbi:MAG TPA: 5'-3' exonuclease H3TH domain-containing protein [Verrucomicrobiae bacterium]